MTIAERNVVIAKDLLYVDLNDGKTMIEVSEIAATGGYVMIDIA